MSSDLITQITVITTLLTALATFLTVLEMKKQRQNAYLPDIFVKDSLRNFYGFEENDLFNKFRFELSKESLEELKAVEKLPMSWYELQLYNIGFGAAKFVEYEWKFSFKKFYELLISVNNGHSFIFEYKVEYDVETVYIKSISNEYLTYLNFSKELALSKFDFLNSSNMGKNNQAIALPDAYINLLSYYLCLKYELNEKASTKSFIQDNLNEIPKLQIKLKYIDIGNKTHKKNFSLKFSALDNYSFRKERLFNGKLGSYLIVSREIK